MTARSCLLSIALLVLSGCFQAKNNALLLDDTLANYASAIRWGNIDDALSFVDPETLKAHPVSKLDIERYHQVQVTTYNDQAPVRVNDTEVRLIVEIGLVNTNTQAARTIIDKQLWRLDEKANRWYLMSGLPDITAR
jgi:hypothetical protein